MSIKDKIRNHLDKLEELKDIEKEIIDSLPNGVWEKYNQLQAEIQSDKSVIAKDIKDSGQSIEVDNYMFKMSTRSRTSIPDSFMYTAADLGHLQKLVDMGVITGVKVNEDMIGRLPPELTAIYSGLVDKKSYKVLSWPKKADL